MAGHRGSRCILDKERPGCEKDGGDSGVCRDLKVPASVYFSEMISEGSSQVRTCCSADAEDRAKDGSYLRALHGMQSYQERRCPIKKAVDAKEDHPGYADGKKCDPPAATEQNFVPIPRRRS